MIARKSPRTKTSPTAKAKSSAQNNSMPCASSADLRQQKQIDTARYIAELSAEMAAMAGSERMDVLAYFLSMARVEAELCARNHQI
jgi:hypothetical protein